MTGSGGGNPPDLPQGTDRRIASRLTSAGPIATALLLIGVALAALYLSREGATSQEAPTAAELQDILDEAFAETGHVGTVTTDAGGNACTIVVTYEYNNCGVRYRYLQGYTYSLDLYELSTNVDAREAPTGPGAIFVEFDESIEPLLRSFLDELIAAPRPTDETNVELLRRNSAVVDTFLRASNISSHLELRTCSGDRFLEPMMPGFALEVTRGQSERVAEGLSSYIKQNCRK